MELSIVMPCLNEAKTVGHCVEKALECIKRNGIMGEIVVADNGSTDGSVEIAESAGARVVHVKDKGYGAALSGGISAARGEYIIMGDADDSYNFAEIMPFVLRLREGYDLVMGCRLPSGGGSIMPGAMPWKNRWIGNPTLSWLGRLFFRVPVSDFHCGLRGFRRDSFERMDLHTTGMEFASEMVVKASLLRMKMSEVPITLYKDGRGRPPHLRPWRDGWRHLRFMLIYSPKWLFLLPGFFFFFSGLALFCAILPGPLTVGSVHFDTNTLIVSAMSAILGFQLISFYVFTRVFAMAEGLMPDNVGMKKAFSFNTLEVGVFLGAVMSIAGFGFLVRALTVWSKVGYGPLSYPDSLRQVVPAVTLLILGVQMIFSFFFLGVLGLHRR